MRHIVCQKIRKAENCTEFLTDIRWKLAVKTNESTWLHFWEFCTLTFVYIFKTVPILCALKLNWWTIFLQWAYFLSNETFFKQLKKVNFIYELFQMALTTIWAVSEKRYKLMELNFWSKRSKLKSIKQLESNEMNLFCCIFENFIS